MSVLNGNVRDAQKLLERRASRLERPMPPRLCTDDNTGQSIGHSLQSTDQREADQHSHSADRLSDPDRPGPGPGLRTDPGRPGLSGSPLPCVRSVGSFSQWGSFAQWVPRRPQVSTLALSSSRPGVRSRGCRHASAEWHSASALVVGVVAAPPSSCRGGANVVSMMSAAPSRSNGDDRQFRELSFWQTILAFCRSRHTDASTTPAPAGSRSGSGDRGLSSTI